MRLAGWVSIPVLFVALSALEALHLRQAFGSPALLLALRCAFLGALPALVAVLVTRSFLRRGDLGLLVLGGGVVLWGLTTVASVVAELVGSDAAETIHDGGALLAGGGQAIAAGLLQGRTWRVARRGLAAAAGWALALAVVAGLSWLTLSGALPVFFVDGVGGTPIRQATLAGAVGAFAAAAAALARGSSRPVSRRWYALGLGLLATGLYGVLHQETSGDLIGWAGRIAQLLAGLAMLAATVTSLREAQAWAPILSDDAERRRHEQALVEANARLADADRNKTRFLAVLSHELRNPLAPIRNAAATLVRAAPGSPHAERALGILSRQVEQMTRLVDELLDLTRISNGKIRLQPTALDLAELVRRAGEDRRDSFTSRGIRFAVEVPEERLHASGDPIRLGQVIGNLLQNSAKFTPAGGEVTLALRGDGAAAELRVRDSGAGIEPSLLARLFDPFVQGESTLARTEGGLGLGLALVKGLVELHGGSIEARSDGPGRGTEMIVRLPILAAQAGSLAEAEPATGPAPAETWPAGP